MSMIRWFSLCFIFALNSFADDDEDIFADFEDIPIEFDEEFPDDDFASIESDGVREYVAGSIVSDPFEQFALRDLQRRENSISLWSGNETIASTYHATLFPQGRFLVWKIYGHLGMPVRFPLYDNQDATLHGLRRRGFFKGKSLITPRSQDFRSFWDAERIVRHFEIASSKDPHFLRLSRNHAVTLGKGELLKNISPDGLYDVDHLFLSGHTEWDNVRIDGFLAPLIRAEMFGLSTRVTPLSMTDAPDFVRNLNFSATYVNDFFAPNELLKQDEVYLLDTERRKVKKEHGLSQGMAVGALSEFMPVSWLSLKPYVSYGHLWLSGFKENNVSLALSHGGGVHVGHDFTVDFFPPSKRSILVLTTEGRLFSSGYSPSYFGPTYFIDRESYNVDGNLPLTKSQFMRTQRDGHFRIGYLVELGYAYEDMISVQSGFESAHSLADGKVIAPLRKLHFITSFTGLDVFRFHIGYQVTTLSQMKELFDFEKSRALLSLRGQLRMLPFLYFDTWVKHSFGINDMFNRDGSDGETMWLSSLPETKSLNFGLGLELAMTF